jgi:aldose 1-epimerase
MISLRSSTGSEVLVAPHWGGGLCAWRCRGRDVLRPAPVAVTDPLQLASFPLVPFSNRIAQGRFHHAGRLIQLAPNWTRDPHTIHGCGWTLPWSVADCTPSSARLELEHEAGDWPWSFRAEQSIRLAADVLELRLALTNAGPEPMPGGLGQHPCFPRPAGTVLEATTRSVWLTGPTGLPERCIEVPEAWRFDGQRSLDGLALDHVFGGWNGVAVLRWPDDSCIRISAGTAAAFLVVYAPASHALVCLEPVTHMTDAVNRPEPPALTGYRLLCAGETLQLSLRMEFHDL